jgi:hypothetical protein
MTNTLNNQLRKRNGLFYHKFQDFQSMITWPYCFGLVASQDIMNVVCGGIKLFILELGSKNREEK